jgi:solute carrier family 25 citrate transporter 1
MIERSMLGRKDPVSTSTNSTTKTTTTTPSQQNQGKTGQGKPVRPIRPPAPSIKGFSQELKPGIESFSANVRDMYNTRGVRAFVQGFSPTLLRQISNSVVRFTTYNFLKQAINPNSNEPVSSYLSFALGITAGAVEVVATQPVDVIKTRMQSSNARSLYRTSMMCSYKIFTQEGPTKLWTGMTPRFIKVSFSGGIVFTVYEITNKLVSHAMSENPFAPE